MKTREGYDKHGKFIEEERGGGWRKISRDINGHKFRLIGSDTDDFMAAIKSTGIDLKLNTMSDRVEVMVNGNGTRPLNDLDESVLLGRLLDYGMKNEGYMRKSMHTLATQNKYHPIKSYLSSLAWDGKGHIEALYNKLDVDTPAGYVFFRKFLLGSVAKVLDEKQNYMLVLVGAQGKGKSKFARWLCPLPKLFHEGPINPDNKDDQIRLIETWLWEVAELDSTTRRSDRSALKFFITQEIVKVRVPYGRYDITKPAAASLIGTVNDDGTGFLSDPTSDRRFAILNLTDIDWSYTKIDINQVWAEAYACYQGGESHELTVHEREIQNEINGSYQTVSPLEDLLLENFTLDPSATDKFMSTMGILSILEDYGLRSNNQFQAKMQLGEILTKNGLKKTRKYQNGRQQNGYVGICVNHENINI